MSEVSPNFSPGPCSLRSDPFFPLKVARNRKVSLPLGIGLENVAGASREGAPDKLVFITEIKPSFRECIIELGRCYS